ncbi:uncharacterized protein LOC133806294 isoform X2 [Humulus lupulus]|uniref:uncharacterized protein LOC133806294 isoform X2 n=1 Tax=Humulus lupulus TaxID=3486 RepID=UPI002B40E40C|nr:uncharacterized protein LOC133806294 isoform X2 [Humulus lupulus]
MGDEEAKKNEALQIIAQYTPLPRLFVFDLDYTLWPLYCEFNEDDDKPRLYAESSLVLHALKDKGIDLAVASRTPTPKVASAFLKTLAIDSIFLAKEIHKKTGVPFTSMLFFDDEDRNIRAVSKMGATCILVENGVNLGALRQGLMKFSQTLTQVVIYI